MSGTRRANRFSSIAYQNLNVVSESGEELQCECPFCFSGTALYFNDVEGLWICFKCGEKGSAKTLIELLDGTYVEPEVELEQISDQLRSLSSDVRNPARAIPDSYLRRFSVSGDVHELWSKRGFDKAACHRWELGYDFIENALTLPVRDPHTGHLAGIVKRLADPGNGPRYQFPHGFARNRSLYGSWLLAADILSGARNPAEPVVIAEGPTDAVRSSQVERHAALAQYGSSISAGQIRLLHRLGVERLILFYDYDRAGLEATRKGEALAEEFLVTRARWNREKYCWHQKVCGCSNSSKDSWKEHTRNLGSCPAKRFCKCGRIHEPDPCSLDLKEIETMLNERIEV